MLLANRQMSVDPGHAVPAWRRALKAFVIIICAAPLLTGCGNSGFRPLHGSAAVGGANATEKLAQVEIGKIPGRVGQRIRNELIFQTTGGGHAVPHTHRLDIAVQESVTSTLVRQDGDAASQIYSVTANFKLTRLSDNSVELEGTSYSKVGFNRFTSIYSNVRARRNAEDRAAVAIGDDLKSRISAYLSGAA